MTDRSRSSPDHDDTYSEFWAGYDEPDVEEECCQHCGKPFEDFSDLGCGYCDARHPDWGIMP